jgi:hypothetical protein
MMKSAITVLAAVLLAHPVLSIAADKPANGAKPTSYVPQAHSASHVYGSPIPPAIVGHAKTSPRKQAPKKRSSSVANRAAR